MTYQDIRYQPGPVARVTLNRPHKLNAQSWNLLAEMDDAFSQAVNDPEVRVILLSGEGRAFSAGHDLDSEEQLSQRREQSQALDGYAKGAQLYEIYTESHLRWRNLPKPTVAMVHGYCIYGGWMIAAAMDFIFASRDALFIPTFGDYFTPHWDMGPRKAKEVLYENSFLTAEMAMQWGFVNRVYAPDELEAETLKYCGRVADQSPYYTRQVKFHINQAQDGMGFSQSVRQAGEYFLRAPQRPRGEENQTAREPRFRNATEQAMQYLKEDSKAGNLD